MSTLTLAAAQYSCVAGDLPANIARHLAFMDQAAAHGVDLLVFPELSLTGYEPRLAPSLALVPDDSVLQPLRERARQLGMDTVVGAPMRLPDSPNVLIAALTLHGDGRQSLYFKQHLHPGEEQVFSPGHGGAALGYAGRQVALAVCADFAQPDHVAAAAAAGAQVYAASVLISEGGYAHDSQLLQGYAREHPIGILLANHGGPSGGWACAGRSALWTPGGALLVAAQGAGDCLVIARSAAAGWQGQVVELSALPC